MMRKHPRTFLHQRHHSAFDLTGDTSLFAKPYGDFASSGRKKYDPDSPLPGPEATRALKSRLVEFVATLVAGACWIASFFGGVAENG